MKTKLFAVVVSCLAAVPVYASTVTPAATGNAKAEIITPVTLAHDGGATLNFGRMVVMSAGTVEVLANSSTGAANYTGGVSLASGGDAAAADRFTVTGLTSGITYNVNLPASITLDLNSDPSKHLTVSSLSESAGAGSTASSFYVGGTLTVPADATAGTYTGNYSVTITY